MAGVALERGRVGVGAAGACGGDPDRCEISLERDDSLPPVRANAVLAERILVNLLSNASRYGDPPILLNARRAGTVVQFTVQDSGHGFTLQRHGLPVAPISATNSGSTGVGLAISRLFASVMGGWLDVESASSGSRVSLCLPVARAR